MRNNRYSFFGKVIRNFIIILLMFILVACNNQRSNSNIVKSLDELGIRINEAKDNDIIYVDDINFKPGFDTEYITDNRKEVKKNITIKSGKGKDNALFTNGMFLLSGSKIASEKITINFDSIIFDFNIDNESITGESLPEEGYYSNAILFEGNLDCSFKNCIFKNYFGYSGSVFEIRYADYTNNEYYRDLYKDQSGCKLSLDFDNCKFLDNYSFYSGGAIYIESNNNNVEVNMNNCELSNNKSGAYYGFGGGAIYANSTSINLNCCILDNNQGDYCYPLLENYYPLYAISDPKGGAIHLENSSLNMVNCVITNNKASVGGAIALTNTDAIFDGCSFTKNKASRASVLVNEAIEMPCNTGRGGALYIDGDKHTKTTIINTYLYNNSAEIAYGGIFQYYNGPTEESLIKCYLDIISSTYLNNTVDTVYDYNRDDKILWNNVPGDIWTDPNIKTVASLIVDDSFETVFVKNEYPNYENNYCYFTSPSNIVSENIDIDYISDENRPFVKYPNDSKWKIPKSIFTQYINDFYNGKVSKGFVGSNYKESIYETKGYNNDWIIIVFCVVIIITIGGLTTFIFVKKKKYQKENVLPNMVVKNTNSIDENKYIVVRHSEEEIERIISKLPEANSLTKREHEVLREMLLGKKQIEIGNILFISTSTVKDFYQKIYTKLGVENKDALFKKVFDESKEIK